MQLNLILSLLLFLGQIVQAQEKLNPVLEPFRVLIGTWETKTAKGQQLEVWEYQDKNTLIGKSYKISGSDKILEESVELAVKGKDIFYTPRVVTQNNGEPIPFKLISSENNRLFVFENKMHDFPQRIAYHFKSDNSLLAWIEGDKGGHSLHHEFSYQRVAK